MNVLNEARETAARAADLDAQIKALHDQHHREISPLIRERRRIEWTLKALLSVHSDFNVYYRTAEGGHRETGSLNRQDVVDFLRNGDYSIIVGMKEKL